MGVFANQFQVCQRADGMGILQLRRDTFLAGLVAAYVQLVRAHIAHGLRTLFMLGVVWDAK
ncbi:hypothetical protein D9M72_609600 [compost metagenome]